MSRRRLALLVVAFVFLTNVWLDYQLLLRNPDEQEAQLQRLLQYFLPNYAPSIERTEFEWWSGKLVLHDVVLHEAGDPTKQLIKIPRLEVEGQGFPVLESLTLTAVDPEVALRLDEGGLNINLEPGEGEASPPLFDVSFRIERGRLKVTNQLKGMKPGEGELLFTEFSTEVSVAPDGSYEGAGEFRLGALFPSFHRLAGENKTLPGIEDRRFKEIAEELEFELVKAPRGPVRVGVSGRVQISEAIRTVIPPKFQEAVWRTIGVTSGEVDVALRLTAGETTHVGVSITPQKAVIQPAGFPIPITEIEGGEFQVNVAIGSDGSLKLLGVTFEGVRARIDRPGTTGDLERGRVVGRGAVYPGGDDEAVTIYMYIDVKDLPLSDNLRAAFPASIRKVYERFDPRGVLPGAKVQLFKGAFERDILELDDGAEIVGVLVPGTEELPVLQVIDVKGRKVSVPRETIVDIKRYDAPEISVFVPSLGGGISAMFKDIPVRLQEIDGWFDLKEGANVEVSAEGKLEVGGTARVRAMVMHGDLISVEVWGKDVPVRDGERLISALPGGSPEMLRPFRIHGGTIDFHTTIEKPSPGAPVQPKIDMDLHGVSFMHDIFPRELTATGRLRVVPWFDPGDELSSIEMEMNLELEGRGIAAVASGRLRLPPIQPEVGVAFESDLAVRASRIDVGDLPTDRLTFLKKLGLRGDAVDVKGWIGGPQRLEVRARGRGLTAKADAFPYLAQVDELHVSLAGDEVTLHSVRGRASGGGTYSLSGRVLTEGDADLDLAVVVKGVVIEPALLDALPEAVRHALAPMRLRGPFSTAAGTKLRLKIPARGRAEARGTLELNGVTGFLDAFHEDMAGLSNEPVRDVKGKILVGPLRVELQGLRGRFMDSEASISGSVGLSGEGQAPFDIKAVLGRLTINEHARRMAGPRAKAFFDMFRTEGPAELSFRVHREAGEDVRVDLEAKPQGMTIVPEVLVRLPIVDVTGRVVLENGEPTTVDIRGYLEPPPSSGWSRTEGGAQRRSPILIRRDSEREGRFPGHGSEGRVYSIGIENLHRFEDPRKRAAFERELPADWLSNLTRLNPKGSMNVEAWVYQPDDDPRAQRARLAASLEAEEITQEQYDLRLAQVGRKPIRWVAEVDLQDFGFTTGMPFDGINGKVRVQGRLAEFEKGSCEGDMRLRSMDWKKQTFSNVNIRFDVTDGLLSLGKKGAPFTARIYGGPARGSGRFKGLLTFDFETKQYRGWLGLLDGRMSAFMRELDEFKAAKGRRDRATLVATLVEARRVGNAPQIEKLEVELRELEARQRELLTALSKARKAGDEVKLEGLQEELAQLLGRGRKGKVPYRGTLFAVLEFGGGGRDLQGRPVPLHGQGSFVLEDANIIDVPQLQIIKNVVNAVTGQITSSKALENMELSFKLKPDRIVVRRMRLSGDEVAVLAKGGYIRFDGRLRMTLVPFDTEGVLYDVFEWVPLTGYNVSGSLDDYQIRTLPAILSPEWIRRQLIPGDIDDD